MSVRKPGKKEIRNFTSMMEKFGWSYKDFISCPVPTYLELVKACVDMDKEAKKKRGRK